MGYMRHHAIIVTSYDLESMQKAREEIIRIGSKIESNLDQCKKLMSNAKYIDGSTGRFEKLVSECVVGVVNGSCSIFIAPDGSKEGWYDSDNGDVFRNKIVEYLESLRYDDGSNSYNWVEIQFGDDNGQTKIIGDSDEHMRVNHDCNIEDDSK